MKRIGLLIFIAMTCVLWANTLPEVDNLSFAQRQDGSMLIDVFYDVFDADGDTLTVTMEASEDGGETWTVSCDSILGDIGEYIVSGTGKQIIWNFGAEHPGVFSDEYRVRILVDDNYIEQIDGMVFVEGGTFEMGDHFNEGSNRELPVHEVTLNSFYIGQYEVTQSEYAALIGSNPASGYGVGDNYPVYNVEWYDAVEYCNALSIQEGLSPCYDLSDWSCDFSADGYRLPTEAEWEYAARGGVNWTDNYRYSGTTDNLGGYAVYSANDPGHSEVAGSKLSNQLDIYDMSGNVWEWCNDWYSESYYSSSPANNPTGPDSGYYRMERGGGWYNHAGSCRVANRYPDHSGHSGGMLGFRILRGIINENTAPDMPENPSPENGAIDVPVNTSLDWYCSDPNWDELGYDVYFGEIPELDISHLVAEDITDASWELENLNNNTTYYWKITASDGEFETESEVWNFTTIIENTAPYMPVNPSPENGAIDVPVNTSLSWECSDPEGDELSYDVYFGEIPELDVSHLVAEDITEAGWVLENLNNNTTFYWNITASDGEFETAGEVWNFTTIEEQQSNDWCTVPAGTYTWSQYDSLKTIGYDYEIMKYEVTNAQYVAYLEEAYAAGDVWIQSGDVYGYYAGDEYYGAGNYVFYDLGTPLYQYYYGRISYDSSSFIINVQSGYFPGDFDDHPVVLVTWIGAHAFAEYYGWLLPTEQEWEKAARGMTGYEYPWGNNISGDRANYWDSVDPWDNGTTPVGYYNGENGTIDSHSAYGCYDMCGNVSDWTDSWYNSYPYRVLRGGSWLNNLSGLDLCSWYRYGHNPDSSSFNFGFRCSRTVP